MKSCPTCHRTYPDDTLAFCLVDGSVLSAPYDREQTQRIPPPRATNPPPTEILGRKEFSDSSKPLSTIHAPAPSVPPLYPSSPSFEESSHKKSIAPWLLIGGAILMVGIFGVVVLALKFTSSDTSARTEPTPKPTATAKVDSKTMCGQTVSAALFLKWTEMGGETGKLGCPINQETDAPASPQGSTGRWIQFAKGDGGYLIENTGSDTGRRLPLPVEGKAVEVTGCIFMLYSSLGGTKSWLGFPTGDGRETSTGARQDFEGGYILWDRKTSQCRPYKNDGIGSGDGTK